MIGMVVNLLVFSLYAFASTGLVQSEEHRKRLVKEIKGDIQWCKANPDTEEAKSKDDLKDLVAFVSTAPIEAFGEIAP
jgi:hypothetical protein